jgi:hypothetical protein
MQIAANPLVCSVPVPTSIALVKETDNWDLLRIGVTADLMLGEHVKLTADAAYVRASQKATDDHFFTFGIDPASGNGQGFQIDAIVSYQFTNAFNIGIGGRWWHLDTNSVDAFQQLETYHTDRYGVFSGRLEFNQEAMVVPSALSPGWYCPLTAVQAPRCTNARCEILKLSPEDVGGGRR